MATKDSKPNYLVEVVNPVLESFIKDILKDRPATQNDVVKYMIKWANANQDQFSKMNEDLEEEKVNAYGELSESSEHSDDEIDDIVVEKLQQRITQKTSVSAEAFGMFNQKKDYIPKVILKTQQQVVRMKERLDQSFFFNNLSEENKNIIIDACEEQKFNEGDIVIKQGDDGNELFLVDQGQLDCFKKYSNEEEEKFIKMYDQGEAFGELALLYNAPRAATIKAKTECTLFSLDRECFNYIVKDAAQKKREQYENLLANIDILSTIDTYERMQIADALKTENYKAGDYIVREGEPGETFYFIESGEAIATKVITKGEEPEKVYEYSQGDYFGEIALLKDQPRAANIIAKTDLMVACLDRKSFKRLLGPLEDLLKRNFQRYSKLVY